MSLASANIPGLSIRNAGDGPSVATLFGDIEPAPRRSRGAGREPDGPPPTGPFAAVALEQSIDRMLDYTIPPRLIPSLCVGQRVRVPLGKGNRPVHGYVISIHGTTDYPRIKALFEIDD